MGAASVPISTETSSGEIHETAHVLDPDRVCRLWGLTGQKRHRGRQTPTEEIRRNSPPFDHGPNSIDSGELGNMAARRYIGALMHRRTGGRDVTGQPNAKNQKRGEQSATQSASDHRKGQAKPLVVITGAAGKIGTALVKALETKYRVVGIDLSKKGSCLRGH